MEHDGESDNIYGRVVQEPGKVTGWTGDYKKNSNHQVNKTNKIGWDTEKSPADLKILIVTQSTEENRHLERV